jgi:hypothetical protein
MILAKKKKKWRGFSFLFTLNSPAISGQLSTLSLTNVTWGLAATVLDNKGVNTLQGPHQLCV